MFIDIAKKRYSVRSFLDKKVEEEKINSILECAKIAPTAANLQPQKILIINDEASLEKLDKATPYRFSAPLAFVVCYDENICWQRKYDLKKSGDIDASIIATHMILQIEDIGLGATWVMNFNEEILRKQFNIPENIVPTAIIICGYKSKDASPKNTHTDKKDLKETTVYNTF